MNPFLAIVDYSHWSTEGHEALAARYGRRAPIFNPRSLESLLEEVTKEGRAWQFALSKYDESQLVRGGGSRLADLTRATDDHERFERELLDAIVVRAVELQEAT